jgi:hypothetical protein
MRNHCLQRHREDIPYEIAIRNDFVNDSARSMTRVSAERFEDTLISYVSAVLLIQTFLACDSACSDCKTSNSFLSLCIECQSYLMKWEMHDAHKGMVVLRNIITTVSGKESSGHYSGYDWNEIELNMINEIRCNSRLRKMIIENVLLIIIGLRGVISKPDLIHLCDEDFLSEKNQDSVSSGMKVALDWS